MAALALGFIGTAIGGAIGGSILGISAATIGGFVGATIGQGVDSILFPQVSKGPRLSDLRVSSSAYGSPIPLVYGPKNRLAGNIIWSTGLIEDKHKKGGGIGKGGIVGGSTTVTYTYRVSLAVALCEGEVSMLQRIWANSKLIFDRGSSSGIAAPTASVGMVATKSNGGHAVFDTLRFYQGNGTQSVDPTIEAEMGVGDVPAYRHTSYVVIKDLQLADFGNVVPNLEFELEAHETVTAEAIVEDICTRAGIASVDASALIDEVMGLAIATESTGANAIAPLGLVYNFDGVERRTGLVFAKRGGAIAATLALEDMGAAEAGGDAGEPYRFERLPDAAMPKEATVTYASVGLDYQPNTQRSGRDYGASEHNISHEVPLTLTDALAQRVADRLLFEAWAGRRTLRFPLSEQWIDLDPAKSVGVPLPAQAGAGFSPEVMPFRLTRMTRGANGVIECEGRFEDTEVYSTRRPGQAGQLPNNPLTGIADTVFVPMDTAVLQSADDNPGFYWAVGTEGRWRGSSVLRSSDGGANYSLMSGAPDEAVIGEVAVALAAGPSEIWDRGNTLEVVLLNDRDALSSLDEEAVLNGDNAFWLGPADGQGGEIVQFATAELTGPNTYVLSDLLRGRLGTEHAIGGHGADELFVLLERDTLRRSDFGAGDWNKSRLYKPVSTLQTEADATAQSFTNTGEGKRPLSPVHGKGARDGSNNLTLTWVRRSRALQPGLGNGPLPLAEESERYEVDVMDGADVVRTLTVSTPTASYSAAEQTSDGLTPGDPVEVNVYQLSASRGRGHAGNFVV